MDAFNNFQRDIDVIKASLPHMSDDDLFVLVKTNDIFARSAELEKMVPYEFLKRILQRLPEKKK